MNTCKAFIFPAFITEYTRKEIDFLVKNNFNISEYIDNVSNIIGENLPDFSYENNQYQENELFSQLIAYTFSCLISDILQNKGIVPQYTAGYSMGIYANLYAVRSISFDDGIKLITSAYELVNEVSKGNQFGMGAVIGLTYSDIQNLIGKNNLNAEIINVNNEHSIVVAGKEKDIKLLLDCAKEEGAFSVNRLIVKTPYHSKYLLKLAPKFRHFIDGLEIKKATVPVVSTYNQRIFADVSNVKDELIFNLTERINWYNTMKKLIENKVVTFYECGAGKDLSKIARFIDGDYKIKSVHKI